jgi:hypothetical protein
MVLSGDGNSQMLVQPVTAPGVMALPVNFPPGTWIHYWTGAPYSAAGGPPLEGGAPAGTGGDASSGGGEGGVGEGAEAGAGGGVMVPAPIDQVPLFVLAGSIIPMGPELQYVDEKPADPLTLDTYPSGLTSYTLYEDDGISQGYLGGAYSTTKFTADDTSGHVKMTIGPQVTAKYKYAGQILSRTYILKIHLAQGAGAPAGVTRDGNAVAPSMASAFGAATEGWYFDAASATAWVKFPLDSSATSTVSLQ